MVLIHGILLYKRIKKSGTADPWFLRPATLLITLVFVQIGLGVYTWRNPTVFDATAHVATGALILATCTIISLAKFPAVGCMIQKIRDFYELTKPRLTAMVIVTTWLGYAFATHAMHYDMHFYHALIGSWLVASGAAALNEYLERDLDALMRRTQTRPLPQGRVTPDSAFWFGISISTIGVLELAFFVNPLTSLLAMLSLGSYLLVYTPLKTRTSLCTLVGRHSRSHPADDGLDCGPKCHRARRLGSFCYFVFVAAAAFPGDRLDVPRGLCARRLSDASRDRSGWGFDRPHDPPLYRRSGPGHAHSRPLGISGLFLFLGRARLGNCFLLPAVPSRLFTGRRLMRGGFFWPPCFICPLYSHGWPATRSRD